jgi:hypothetical protein
MARLKRLHEFVGVSVAHRRGDFAAVLERVFTVLRDPEMDFLFFALLEDAVTETPVDPKPPAPRAVLDNADVSTSFACVTGANITCAMRSPR